MNANNAEASHWRWPLLHGPHTKVIQGPTGQATGQSQQLAASSCIAGSHCLAATSEQTEDFMYAVVLVI
jgi:hypothetical protein